MKDLSPEKCKYLGELHQRALSISKELHHQEFLMIEALPNIDREKVFRFLGYKSLYLYAVSSLGLSEHRAYNFILVARKASQVEKLQHAFQNKEINISKDLLGQSEGKSAPLDGALKTMAKIFLDKKDPVIGAQRTPSR